MNCKILLNELNIIIVLFILYSLIQGVSLADVSYSQTIGFESSNSEQCNQDDMVVFWKTRGRSGINNAKNRVGSFSKRIAPDITDDWVRSGKCSARCISVKEQDKPKSKGRCMFQLVSNKKQGVERLVKMNTSYWLGFSMKNESGRLESDWELYFQVHNNKPSPDGWGSTMNPMIALERTWRGHYKLVYRFNKKDRTTKTLFHNLGEINGDGYSDFVIQFKLSNPEPNGMLRVWRRDENGEQYKVMDKTNIRLGYHRDNDKDRPVLAFGVYNGPIAATGRTVYFDNIRLTSDMNATINDVDPEFFIQLD